MKPKLFSQVVKNNSGNKKKSDGIIVNGGGENGKATGESGWKVLSRKPITTIKRNDRISGKHELIQVTSIESRRLIFACEINISPTHGTGQSEDLVSAVTELCIGKVYRNIRLANIRQNKRGGITAIAAEPPTAEMALRRRS
jgi:hypothetical protein